MKKNKLGGISKDINEYLVGHLIINGCSIISIVILIVSIGIGAAKLGTLYFYREDKFCEGKHLYTQTRRN